MHLHFSEMSIATEGIGVDDFQSAVFNISRNKWLAVVEQY